MIQHLLDVELTLYVYIANAGLQVAYGSGCGPELWVSTGVLPEVGRSRYSQCMEFVQGSILHDNVSCVWLL